MIRYICIIEHGHPKVIKKTTSLYVIKKFLKDKINKSDYKIFTNIELIAYNLNENYRIID